MCCLYIWNKIFIISSTNLPLNAIFTSSSMSALIKTPRMLHIPTLCPSCALIVDVMGEVLSPGNSFLCCFRPLAHVQPFNLPYLLTFKKFMDSITYQFCSSVRCSSDLGQNVSLVYSSSVTVVYTFPPSYFIPRFREYFMNAYSITVA